MRVVALESTFYAYFSTRRFSSGASYTLAGTPAIHAYEDNSDTQITSGLTLSADADSITGLNRITIAATTANGFEAGKHYTLTIGAGTVDSVSVVGTVVYEFRVESVVERAVRLINETLYPAGVEIMATTTSNSTTAINLTDVVDAQTPDDALVGLVLIVYDATDGRIEVVETTACSSKVATVQQVSDGGAMSFTVATSDRVIISGVAPLRPTTNGRKLDVSSGGEAGVDLANVGSPTTTLNLSGTTISTSQAVASVSGAVGSIASGGITAASIASDALTAAKFHSDVTTELQNGLATASAVSTLQTSVDNVPTNAELATALGTADDAVLAAIAALANLTEAEVIAAVEAIFEARGITEAGGVERIAAINVGEGGSAPGSPVGEV